MYAYTYIIPVLYKLKEVTADVHPINRDITYRMYYIKLINKSLNINPYQNTLMFIYIYIYIHIFFFLFLLLLNYNPYMIKIHNIAMNNNLSTKH